MNVHSKSETCKKTRKQVFQTRLSTFSSFFFFFFFFFAPRLDRIKRMQVKFTRSMLSRTLSEYQAFVEWGEKVGLKAREAVRCTVHQ
jgi:hypothetical protein